MDSFTVPKSDFARSEIVIKKSRFICSAKKVCTEGEAKEFIEKVKADFPLATHHCVAYRLHYPYVERFDDAGEPKGTAGMPMLDAIKKEDVYNIVIVVTRYFGGIMLGAGGLIRAYSSSASAGIFEIGKAINRKSKEITLEIPYSIYDKLLSALKGTTYVEISKSFDELVKLTVVVPADESVEFTAIVRDIARANGKINETDCGYNSFSN